MQYKVSGLEQLSDEDMFAIAKMLHPPVFSGKRLKNWKIVPYADDGISGKGKTLKNDKNLYSFSFDFEEGTIDVYHRTMGDFTDRVAQDVGFWWAIINLLQKRGCALVSS